MIILVDHNERDTNPTIIAQLEAEFGSIQIAQLVSGDVNVITSKGLLAIERKTVEDLLSSIGDGRLFDQASRMIQHAMVGCVVVHGSLLYDRDDYVVANGFNRKWTGMSVRAALRTVQLAGCLVEIVPSNAFASTVKEIINTIEKDHQPHNKQRLITLETMDKRVEFLSVIPGVGPKRAASWLEWSGNRLVSALEYATVFDQLTNDSLPDGFGKKTVASIREFMQLDPNEYLELRQENDEDDQATE